MKITLIAIITAVLFAGTAGAIYYPFDAITITKETTGTVSNYQLIDVITPISILNINMKQSGTASDTIIKCGTTILAKNYAKEIAEINLNYICANDVLIDKTGNDSSFLVLTYVNYNISSSSPTQIVGTVKVASTSHDILLDTTASVSVYNTMTAGDLTISIFLFCIVMLLLLMLFFYKI